MRSVLIAALAVLAAAPLAPAPLAAAATPLEYTKAMLEQTRQIVDSAQSHNQKLEALSALLKDFLDTDAMGRAALDKHWERFTAPQRQEFLQLFRKLFERTYVQKLLLFERPDFAYVGEEVTGSTARVDTKIVTPRDEFAVTYQMRASGPHWLATDIKIEDLSLTVNFRQQLDRLLAKGSVADLLARMRRKYGPGGAGEENL